AGAAGGAASHLRRLAASRVCELDRGPGARRRGHAASGSHSRVSGGFSQFGRILRRVVESTPGLSGAVFTDWQGEPVDQYTRGPTIDIQIIGAQWGLVLTELKPALARMHAGEAR